MDSVNLPEAQSTPLNCKNTACNTSPVVCTCCGSKDYVQTFPQAYCFTPLHPGMPICKHKQESYEENFSFQHPFFSRFPFFPPFFHNNAIPPNVCCAHNHYDEIGKQQIHASEHENSRTGKHYKSRPQEKNDFRDNKTILNENTPKPNNILGPEFPYLWSPFNMANPTDSQINSFFQRCACGDSVPWTYSPFIAPIVSYCLFWNSQKPNINVLPTNYNVGKSDTLEKSKNENFANKNYSNSDNENEKFSKNLTLMEDTKCSSTETKNSLQENGFEVDQQIENTDQNSGNSSTFLSLNSINYPEENNFKNLKILKDEGQNRPVDNCAGEDDTETEGFDSDQEDSDEGTKSDKKVLSKNNSNLYLPSEYNENLKDNAESQSPIGSQSLTNLKSRKSSTNSVDVLLSEIQASDISGAGESNFHSLQDSDDENGKTILQNKDSKNKTQISFKKFIKNFTMTDQTNNVSLAEAQVSVAAAGDLGGVNCDGYKIDITTFEDQQETPDQDSQNEENSDSTKLTMKDLKNCDETKSESFPGKNTNETLKNGRGAKTGIAKLLHNLKSKDSKPDPVKNTKQSKESNPRDPIVTIKRKHNCYSNNTVSVGDKNIKIQKARNYAVAQQQTTGSERQYKDINNKGQPMKKEERILLAKVRPVSTMQKTLQLSNKK